MKVNEEKPQILYVGNDERVLIELFNQTQGDDTEVYMIHSPHQVFEWLRHCSATPALILIEKRQKGASGYMFSQILQARFPRKSKNLAIVIEQVTDRELELARKYNIKEVFDKKQLSRQLARLTYFLRQPQTTRLGVETPQQYRLPLWKRLFDVFLAGTALLLLSPLLMLIAILIKLDSKGPIFYVSKRVGTGYRIFDFYKFRTMRVNADKELDNLEELNQYKQEEVAQRDDLCQHCSGYCEQFFMDGKVICEGEYKQLKSQDQAAFTKIKNDPRITRLGRFLRNTSIDELPQLINILKGDMSIVGNRPLPLYEAEQLTTDQSSARFMAPAGLTGLWQVRKRGQDEMSDEERKALDNEYAQNFSLWMDLKLIVQTLRVFIQKENV